MSKNHLMSALCFGLAILSLSLFIYSFCSHIIAVSVPVILAVLCNMLLEASQYYANKIGLTDLQIGAKVDIDKKVDSKVDIDKKVDSKVDIDKKVDSKVDIDNSGWVKLTGKVLQFVNGKYIISVDGQKVKLYPKTLDIVAKDGTTYKFCGILENKDDKN